MGIEIEAVFPLCNRINIVVYYTVLFFMHTHELLITFKFQTNEFQVSKVYKEKQKNLHGCSLKQMHILNRESCLFTFINEDTSY